MYQASSAHLEMPEKYLRYFKITDLTIQINSDLPMNNQTFHRKFNLFEINASWQADVCIRHHFFLPDTDDASFGRELYRKIPWVIYRKSKTWIYQRIFPLRNAPDRVNQVAVFNSDYTLADIYHRTDEEFLKGSLESLSLLTTDQIFLSHVLSNRDSCYLHACGVNFDGKGLLFAGDSGSGKSTIAAMLTESAQLLCDESIIVKKQVSGFRMFGTWSHGDLPEVSNGSVPLKAILFLEKSQKNILIPIENKKEKTRHLLRCLVKPFISAHWWENTLSLIEKLADEVPCYILQFNKDRALIEILRKV
ncbi:MAG: hypothetical protein Q8N76_04590 [Candidatus Omnitrophota bacterium]|nr:hypothetical protein [Candidatus Omnitrophota bacterium]